MYVVSGQHDSSTIQFGDSIFDSNANCNTPPLHNLETAISTREGNEQTGFTFEAKTFNLGYIFCHNDSYENVFSQISFILIFHKSLENLKGLTFKVDFLSLKFFIPFQKDLILKEYLRQHSIRRSYNKHDWLLYGIKI